MDKHPHDSPDDESLLLHRAILADDEQQRKLQARVERLEREGGILWTRDDGLFTFDGKDFKSTRERTQEGKVFDEDAREAARDRFYQLVKQRMQEKSNVSRTVASRQVPDFHAIEHVPPTGISKEVPNSDNLHITSGAGDISVVQSQQHSSQQSEQAQQSYTTSVTISSTATADVEDHELQAGRGSTDGLCRHPMHASYEESSPSSRLGAERDPKLADADQEALREAIERLNIYAGRASGVNEDDAVGLTDHYNKSLMPVNPHLDITTSLLDAQLGLGEMALPDNCGGTGYDLSLVPGMPGIDSVFPFPADQYQVAEAPLSADLSSVAPGNSSETHDVCPRQTSDPEVEEGGRMCSAIDTVHEADHERSSQTPKTFLQHTYVSEPDPNPVQAMPHVSQASIMGPENEDEDDDLVELSSSTRISTLSDSNTRSSQTGKGVNEEEFATPTTAALKRIEELTQGGSQRLNYLWSQTADEIVLYVYVPQLTQASDVWIKDDEDGTGIRVLYRNRRHPSCLTAKEAMDESWRTEWLVAVSGKFADGMKVLITDDDLTPRPLRFPVRSKSSLGDANVAGSHESYVYQRQRIWEFVDGLPGDPLWQRLVRIPLRKNLAALPDKARERPQRLRFGLESKKADELEQGSAPTKSDTTTHPLAEYETKRLATLRQLARQSTWTRVFEGEDHVQELLLFATLSNEELEYLDTKTRQIALDAQSKYASQSKAGAADQRGKRLPPGVLEEHILDLARKESQRTKGQRATQAEK